MSVHEIKTYYIKCDTCSRAIILECVEKKYHRPLPEKWKRTSWLYPRSSSAGQGGDQRDQCPKCAEEIKLELPEKACDVKITVGTDRAKTNIF